MRKTILVLAVLAVFFCISDTSDAAGIFRRRNAGAGLLPDEGDIPNLIPAGKAKSYSGENFLKYYGAAGNRFVMYGLTKLYVRDYNYGSKDRRVTIEVAVMENPTSAAGIYHFTRAKVVGQSAAPIGIGAEGLLDGRRGNRNLYFHRSNQFVKIIYTGPEPVPDLQPVARAIDEKIPKGRDQMPDGFDYIRVAGVNQDTIELTPGFTFNIDFMPPSVWAGAPGGGSPATDLFIITRMKYAEAQKLVKDYTAYLKFNAEYIEPYAKGDIKYVKAVDPNQGRVLFTAHKNVVIIVARPDGYEKGEPLIEAVIAKIDELNPGRR